MTMRWTRQIAVVAAVSGLCALPMAGQEKARVESSVQTEHTFYLNNSESAQDQTEIVNALRNGMDGSTRVFAVYSQEAIVVVANAQQMELAQKLVQELDRPRKMYRLTYTLTELDGGKRIGSQHFAVVVAGGQRTQMKQGNRVPLVTGTAPVTNGTASTSTQITYIDVGLNVDATVDPLENGVALKTKVEVSGVAGEMTSALAQDPVLRQTQLEGTAVLTLGKAVELGSLDMLGSTRHTQVEVVAELVK